MPRTLSAGVVIVRRLRGGPHYLLLRAFSYWDFPKGKVERGETPLAAARREVREETTLVDLDFRWGEAFVETPPYARGKVARYYIAECATGGVTLPVNPLLGRAEHHEYRWVEYGAACKLVNPRVRAVLDWADGFVRQTGDKAQARSGKRMSRRQPPSDRRDS